MTRGQRRWIERLWVAMSEKRDVLYADIPVATRQTLRVLGMIEVRVPADRYTEKTHLTTLGEITYNEQVSFKERHPERSYDRAI